MPLPWLVYIKFYDLLRFLALEWLGYVNVFQILLFNVENAKYMNMMRACKDVSTENPQTILYFAWFNRV